MPSPSKAKGSSWERDVARFLSSMYNESFIRAPGSGAYTGGKNVVRKSILHEGQIRNFKGDIVPGESFPKFNAECKSYKDFPFHLFFSGPIRQLDEWIDQLLDAADEGDFNILIMKFNNKGKYIATEAKHFPPLAQPLGIQYHHQKDNSLWQITEYNNFWQFNKDAVKALCT